jgi:integrase
MQNGQIKKRGASWVLRYWETVLVNGAPVRRRVLKRLAPITAQYHSAKSVEHLAAEILGPLNTNARPEVTGTLANFLEKIYLPVCKTELKPSTVKGYTDMWKLVQPHLNGMELRAVRTSDIERMLRAVADRKALARTTLANCRNFLSGAFRYAIRTDRYTRGNPVREVKTPKGKKPANVPAYALEEITTILDALNGTARTVVLTAALSGLRHSEIRALKWDDFTGDEILVRRSAWRTWVSDEGDTKTEGSAAPVPCVPVLAKALKAHRKHSKAEFIFAGATGRPLVLANLLRREIRPALVKIGFQWRGWHGFRRGLATNLYRLGVPDMVIQRILRHANVQTTQAHYVKTSDADTRAAMKKLERAFGKA